MIRRWFQRDLSTGADESVIGRTGRVTGTIETGQIGEVMIGIRGGTEAYFAHPYLPDEKFQVGQLVVVVEYAEPRIVYVSAAL